MFWFSKSHIKSLVFSKSHCRHGNHKRTELHFLYRYLHSLYGIDKFVFLIMWETKIITRFLLLNKNLIKTHNSQNIHQHNKFHHPTWNSWEKYSRKLWMDGRTEKQLQYITPLRKQRYNKLNYSKFIENYSCKPLAIWTKTVHKTGLQWSPYPSECTILLRRRVIYKWPLPWNPIVIYVLCIMCKELFLSI